tara:strand:- start:97 stop:555 length:459 start_codon:yes stop_codon:yes gene_type:complete
MIKVTRIENDDLINELLDLLEYWKARTPILEIRNAKNKTQKGYQTGNVLYPTLHSKLVKELKLEEYNFDHMHLIEYFEGGYQDSHNHEEYEDRSFILYLNDSDGDTVFYRDNEVISTKPKRGKLVMFDANIQHQGLESKLNKKVAVGGLKCK